MVAKKLEKPRIEICLLAQEKQKTLSNISESSQTSKSMKYA